MRCLCISHSLWFRVIFPIAWHGTLIRQKPAFFSSRNPKNVFSTSVAFLLSYFRDLAARNCMLTANLVAKVGGELARDFLTTDLSFFSFECGLLYSLGQWNWPTDLIWCRFDQPGSQVASVDPAWSVWCLMQVWSVASLGQFHCPKL